MGKGRLTIKPVVRMRAGVRQAWGGRKMVGLTTTSRSFCKVKPKAARHHLLYTCVMGSTAGHAPPQTTTAAQRETRPKRSTEERNVCQTPCSLISPGLSDCFVCEHQDAATKASIYELSCLLQSSWLLASSIRNMYASAGTRLKGRQASFLPKV